MFCSMSGDACCEWAPAPRAESVLYNHCNEFERLCPDRFDRMAASVSGKDGIAGVHDRFLVSLSYAMYSKSSM